MKVLIPIEETGKKDFSKVGNLDNSTFVCIYDQEKDTAEYIPMEEISPKKGNLSVAMKLKGIETMICSSIPSLAYDLFTVMGITIFQSTLLSVKDNIDAMNRQTLKTITASNELNMSGCVSSSCASCSSAC